MCYPKESFWLSDLEYFNYITLGTYLETIWLSPEFPIRLVRIVSEQEFIERVFADRTSNSVIRKRWPQSAGRLPKSNTA